MDDKKKTLKNTLKGIGITWLAYLAYKLIFPSVQINDRVKMYQQASAIIKQDTLIGNNELQYAADSINKNSHRWIDSITEFIDADVLPNKTLQYNIALKIDRKLYDIPKVKKLVEKSLSDSISTIPELRSFNVNKVTIIYNYTDIKKNPLFKIVFTPDKYK